MYILKSSKVVTFNLKLLVAQQRMAAGLQNTLLYTSAHNTAMIRVWYLMLVLGCKVHFKVHIKCGYF